jgi:hypothetical protein
MSSNPELRVIRIKDDSLLDPDGMAMLKGMDDENDFQIWIERVADSDPIAVVIEDGSVAISCVQRRHRSKLELGVKPYAFASGEINIL